MVAQLYSTGSEDVYLQLKTGQGGRPGAGGAPVQRGQVPQPTHRCMCCPASALRVACLPAGPFSSTVRANTFSGVWSRPRGGVHAPERCAASARASRESAGSLTPSAVWRCRGELPLTKERIRQIRLEPAHRMSRGPGKEGTLVHSRMVARAASAGRSGERLAAGGGAGLGSGRALQRWALHRLLRCDHPLCCIIRPSLWKVLLALLEI